jgi:multimeric flavodoxin WrbA
MKLKILGISAAHREGRRNTTYALEEALYAAQGVADVEPSLLELNDKRIELCGACDQCIGQRNGRGEIMELYGCKIRDDMQWIYPKLLEQDAIIFGAPVHILGMSSRMKAFIDRLRWMVHCAGRSPASSRLPTCPSPGRRARR